VPLRNKQQRSIGGTFTYIGDEPLGDAMSIRLPLSIHNIVKAKPNRTEWLRTVIAAAVQAELDAENTKSE
jgi:hypothetical protein